MKRMLSRKVATCEIDQFFAQRGLDCDCLSSKKWALYPQLGRISWSAHVDFAIFRCVSHARYAKRVEVNMRSKLEGLITTMVGGAVVVFGSSGFIGTRLIRSLVGRGVHVRALDILPPRQRYEGVDYANVDVRFPIDPKWGLDAALMYNLAAVHRSPGHLDHEYFETNVAGALNVTALAEACDVKAIVFTSSISVYGACEDLVDESSPLSPSSSYGRSKNLAEQIHRRWLNSGDERRLVVVRPGVVFGPGEAGNYTQLIKALRGGYFAFPGRRDTVKSGGSVDELLLTLDFVLSLSKQDVLYNFAFPQLSTTQEIVEALDRVIGQKSWQMTMPLRPMLLVARLFEIARVFGIRSWINRDRVMKLVQSTRIAPGWLLDNGYVFTTDLEEALRRWGAETNGQFE